MLILRDPSDFDLAAKRTIHEVAHQWFGHILAAKTVEGSSILIEGLAKYSEAVLMEKMYGKGAVWQLSKNANARYFNGRAHETEQESPLYLVKGQGYLSYGKSFTVMTALRDLIGEKPLNNVIKNMIDRHRDKVALEITALQFLKSSIK